jgi:formylglycine-generating enzyme required for sulfatase activity
MHCRTLVRSGVLGCAVLVANAFAVTGGAPQQAQVTEKIDPAALVNERDGMVLVPAGEFKLGSTKSDHWADEDEFPQRTVQLPAFYIDQLEVSNLQYRQFLEATGWPAPAAWGREHQYPEGADFMPVTDVCWWDAMAYARWAHKRLPTEAEWEKAARGTDGRRFPWGEEFEPDHANGDRYLLPVGSNSLGATPYGALDMAGNVAEWTASAYEPYPRPEALLPSEFGGQAGTKTAAVARDASMTPAFDTSAAVAGARVHGDDYRLQFFTPEELKDERQRTYRGGSFNSYARFLRCANREHASPGARWGNIGFRCASDVVAPDGPAH